jgi:methylene-fatty-acyl-phospholipid synthase
VAIFCIGLIRDHLYNEALSAQPLYSPLCQPLIGYGLIATGNVLVLSSMWALGVTGTYLGDYFGILMDEKVASFPFNIIGAPMYWGSTCSFLGVAFLRGRLAGFLLTAEVFIMYLMALSYEEYGRLRDCFMRVPLTKTQSIHRGDIREERHPTRHGINGEGPKESLNSDRLQSFI